MNEAIHEKPIIRGLINRSRPCMRCQFGIFDVPVDGMLNCFEAGTSGIKLLTKAEVEDMISCDRMLPWQKMTLVDEKSEEYSGVKAVDRILGNQR